MGLIDRNILWKRTCFEKNIAGIQLALKSKFIVQIIFQIRHFTHHAQIYIKQAIQTRTGFQRIKRFYHSQIDSSNGFRVNIGIGNNRTNFSSSTEGIAS